MSDFNEKNELMLFNYETTYLTSFRDGEITTPVKTVYKKKETCLMPRPPPLKDIHTLTNWKTHGMPFDLLIKPKEIIRTNPWTVQKPYGKAKDTMREQVQKTRPRLVMTPAVSIDDIEDPKVRSILVADSYDSAQSKALREAVSYYPSVRAPLRDRPAPANPIVLPKLNPYMVAPEWRMETVEWDNKQLRAHCDPTKEFWMSHELERCVPCEQTALVKAQRLRAKRSGR